MHPRSLIERCEALVEERRRLLAEAEAALAEARERKPAVGDYARSTLTHFYGRVTRVIERPGRRCWVEIIPHITPEMPGRHALDLFDRWELIDPPETLPAGEPPSLVEITEVLVELLRETEPKPPERNALAARK